VVLHTDSSGILNTLTEFVDLNSLTELPCAQPSRDGLLQALVAYYQDVLPPVMQDPSALEEGADPDAKPEAKRRCGDGRLSQ
jgi:hypothetical protein